MRVGVDGFLKGSLSSGGLRGLRVSGSPSAAFQAQLTKSAGGVEAQSGEGGGKAEQF